MATSPTPIEQENITANTSRHLIFWPDTDLCYNYKTGQWTRVPAYNGLRRYSVFSTSQDIGLIRYSAGSVDLQGQTTSMPASTALLETGSLDLNTGGRVVVNGIRPLINGGTHTVRIGVQDDLAEAVTWSTSVSVNSRTKFANVRAEGRYVRGEVTITGGFTTAQGADVEFSPQGKV